MEYSKPYGDSVFYGSFEGIITNLQSRYRETQSDVVKTELESIMGNKTCPVCHGARLKKEALALTLGGKNLSELTTMPVTEALAFINSLELSERDMAIAHQILKELRARLGFLINVGLNYLTPVSYTHLSDGQ